jgi:hypothetical protein
VASLDEQKDAVRATYLADIAALDDQIAQAFLDFEQAWSPLTEGENYQRMTRRWADARRKWLARYAR